MSSTFKVGLLVIIGVLLFLGIEIYVQKLFMMIPNTQYYAGIQSAKGISHGAPITMNGIEVGKVTSIELDYHTYKPTVVISIDKDIAIPKEARLVIPANVLGMVDNKIDIVVSGKQSGEFFKEKDVIPADNTSDLLSFSPDLESIVSSIKNTLMSVEQVMVSAGLDKRITDFFDTFGILVKDLKGFTNDLKTVVSENKQEVAQLMGGANRLVSKMDHFMIQMQKSLLDSHHIEKIMDHTSTIAQDITIMTSDFKNVYMSENLSQKVSNSTKNIEDITLKGRDLVDNLSKATEQVSGVMNDSSELIRSTNNAISKADEILDGGIQMLSHFQHAYEHVLPSDSPKTTSDVSYDFKSKHFSANINTSIPYNDHSVEVGFTDVLESNLLNARFITPLNHFSDIAIGSYVGKPSMGLNAKVLPSLVFSSDLYDLNCPKVDLRCRWQLHRNGSVWIEGNDMTRKKDMRIGLGYHW